MVSSSKVRLCKEKNQRGDKALTAVLVSAAYTTSISLNDPIAQNLWASLQYQTWISLTNEGLSVRS